MTTQAVQTFMDSPLTYFGESITPMHSIPREELEELQRQAMIRRFAEHRETIEIVRKLADRLGITTQPGRHNIADAGPAEAIEETADATGVRVDHGEQTGEQRASAIATDP